MSLTYGLLASDTSGLASSSTGGATPWSCSSCDNRSASSPAPPLSLARENGFMSISRNLRDGLGTDLVERYLHSPGGCQPDHANHGAGSARAAAEASRVGMTTPVFMPEGTDMQDATTPRSRSSPRVRPCRRREDLLRVADRSARACAVADGA